MIGNVEHSVEKSYIDNLEALEFLNLDPFRTSPEFLSDQKWFIPSLS